MYNLSFVSLPDNVDVRVYSVNYPELAFVPNTLCSYRC
jgi:hypothetical protein